MLIDTDLPEPVVPATSRCGMRARSTITGSPPMVLPRQRPMRALVCLEILRGEQLAQIDGLALGVGQLDADGVLAGDDGDAAGDGAHRAGDVVGQADDARRLDAGRRLEFVKGDHRAGADVDDLAADAEIVEHAFQQAGVLFERGLADGGLLVDLGLGEKGDRRQNEAALRGRFAGLADGAAAGLGPGGRRRDTGGLDRLAEILLADAFLDVVPASGSTGQ